MITILGVLVAGLGLGAPESPAEPASPTESGAQTEDIDDAARAAYEARDYDTAIDLFERALEDTGDPNYLFNIGRVHEEAGRLEPAVAFYERFLDQPGVALEARAATLERVKVLRGVLEERARAKQTDEPPEEEDTTPPKDADLEQGGTRVKISFGFAGKIYFNTERGSIDESRVRMELDAGSKPGPITLVTTYVIKPLS